MRYVFTALLSGALVYGFASQRVGSRGAPQLHASAQMETPAGQEASGSLEQDAAATPPHAPVRTGASARTSDPDTGAQVLRALLKAAELTEAQAVTNEAELDLLLARLEERARSQKMVTALEVQPGIDAILKLAPELGIERMLKKHADFMQRMAELSAELDGRSVPQTPPSRADVEGQIAGASGATRDHLLGGYAEVLATLPADEQRAAMRNLGLLSLPMPEQQ